MGTPIGTMVTVQAARCVRCGQAADYTVLDFETGITQDLCADCRWTRVLAKIEKADAERQAAETAANKERERVLQDRINVLENAFRAIEWEYSLPPQHFHQCPVCSQRREDGHAADCIIGQVLKEKIS